MHVVVAILATIVAAQYAVIAAFVVPRLARLAQPRTPVVAAAHWGAVAFFAGCAITHLNIARESLNPGSMVDMTAHSSTLTVLVQMVVPHVAQLVGGVLFIGIARSKLEVSIVSKQTASEQRQLNQQFRLAFDRAPLGIALLPISGVTDSTSYVNPAYLKLLGQDDSSTASGVVETMSFVHPDDRMAVGRAMESTMNTRPIERDLRIVRPGRETRWVRATLNGVLNESDGALTRMTGVFEDITERQQADIDLHASEQKFRELADRLELGVVLRQLDPSQFLYANAEYVRIIGFNPIIDAPKDMDTALNRIHPDDRVRVLTTYWAPSMAGEKASAEMRMLAPDGAIKWIRATTNPQPVPAGTPRRATDTVEDITARKAAEAGAQSARLEAERANLAKSEFLSRMSHELRTPLNAVLGYSQLLKMDLLTESQDEAVDCILSGGRHLLGMIDDILDISRIESDQLGISLEPVRVAEIAGEVADLMGPIAAGASIELSVAPPTPDLSEYVRADKRRLRQVLLNVVSNAIKYNRPGGSVVLACSMADPTDPSDPTRPTDPTEVAISVTDTGIGIRTEDMSRLFSPFDRLGQQTSDIEGTGIGLALSRRLAAIMGGRINVSSVHGEGTVFTVVMPVDQPTHELDTADLIPVRLGPVRSVAHSTLLYIEDNLSNVRLVQRMVEHRPEWELIHAGHGSLGVELAVSRPPTMIMLDLHLPDMDGIDVLHALRQDARTTRIPIIVVSADANQHQIHRLTDAGADHYLTKPLDIAEAMSLLDRHANLPPVDGVRAGPVGQ